MSISRLPLPSFRGKFRDYTAEKVAGKKVHSITPKGNMGYDPYTVPDIVAVEATFVGFL